MKTNQMVPLRVIDIELDGDDLSGFQALTGMGGYGSGQNVTFPEAMPGKRFRITIEALDVTDKLEGGG